MRPEITLAQKMRSWIAAWSKLEISPRMLTGVGFACAVSIVLSSIWVGFLGTASPLWSMEWFTVSRSNPLIVTAASVLLYVAAAGMLVCWILLGRHVFARRGPGLASRTIVSTAALWGVPLLFALPLFDRDIFSYIAQGRLLVYGFDPYRWGIDSVPSWQEVGVDSMWTSTLTPYGPVMLAVQRAIATIIGSPLGYHAVIFAYRILATLCLIVAILLAAHLASRRGFPVNRVLWVTAVNPMFLFTFVIGAHNDALMIVFLLASLAAALGRRPRIALALLALAVGVKATAIVALPILGLIRLGPDATLRAKLREWAISGGILLVILWAIGAAQGLSLRWLLLASTPALTSSWFAPSAIIAAAAAGIGSLLGLSFDITFVVGKGIAIAGAIGAGSYFLLSRRPYPPLHRLVLAFSAVIFFSPVIYSWYLAWPIFVATAAGMTLRARGRLVVALISIFFVAKGIISPFGYSADVLVGVAQGALGALALGTGVLLLWLEAASHQELTHQLRRGTVQLLSGPSASEPHSSESSRSI